MKNINQRLIAAVRFAEVLAFLWMPVCRAAGQETNGSGWTVIEGEQAVQCSFIVDSHEPLHTVQSNGVLQAQSFPEMSGTGASLICTRTRPAGSYDAVYEFELGAALEGDLWVFEQGRNWASPFLWRIDGGPWQAASTELPMLGQVDFINGPSFCWCRLAGLSLSGGRHTLEVRVSEPKADGLFLLSQDCFVIAPRVSGGAVPANYPVKNAVMLWTNTPPEDRTGDGFRPWLEPYLIKTDKPVGSVLVMPGGGYRFRATHEGWSVAQEFNARGLNAFVLQYRVMPHTRQEALLDAQRAMRIIRARAAEWNVLPDKIAVCGFSAGGHLGGRLALRMEQGRPDADDPFDRVSPRPDALILGYASDFCGADDPGGIFPSNFPPVFIWHTGEDTVVDAGVGLNLAQKLKANRIPFEIHVYNKGRHGLGLAKKKPHVAGWIAACCEWLEELGWKEPSGERGLE